MISDDAFARTCPSEGERKATIRLELATSHATRENINIISRISWIVRPIGTWSFQPALPTLRRRSAKVDVVLCNASSRKFRVHEGKIRVGARNIVFTAEWNDDTWIQLIFILDEDGWLRPMNSSFRCCNWWNCNALMTVFSFLFGTLHEDILQGKVNGIIVTGKFKLENTWWNFLAWKIELAMEFLQGCQGYDVFCEWRFFFFKTLHGNIPQEVNNCTRKLKLKKI